MLSAVGMVLKDDSSSLDPAIPTRPNTQLSNVEYWNTTAPWMPGRSGAISQSIVPGVPSNVEPVRMVPGPNATRAGPISWQLRKSTPTTPVVGDWDNNGTTDIGVFRSSTGWWYLTYDLNGSAEHQFVYGIPGDTPIADDWDGDGDATPAIYRP